MVAGLHWISEVIQVIQVVFSPDLKNAHLFFFCSKKSGSHKAVSKHAATFAIGYFFLRRRAAASGVSLQAATYVVHRTIYAETLAFSTEWRIYFYIRCACSGGICAC